MKLFKANRPQQSSSPSPAGQDPATPKKAAAGLKHILPKAKKTWHKLAAHLLFAVIMLVLVVYLFVVWQIRGLVTAEPSTEAESLVLNSTNIPKIDKAAIDQIQSLEQNSPAVRSLFNEARNNPFHE